MNDTAEEPDLTPMLDVVFIMLIFFIVTATFVREKGIELPTKNDSANQETSVESAIVDISANNRFLLNGKNVDRRALQNHLAAYYAENPQSSVVVRPNKESKTEHLVHAMDVGRSIGMRVALADET